jgi:hypothetical protein
MNNLVEDIYKALEPLSDGKRIALSEEDIENFGENIKKVMSSWANPARRDTEFSIRMSNVGLHPRKLWYDSKYKYTGEKNKIKPSTQIKFLYGHLLEELVLLLVKLSGHDVTAEQKEVMVEGVSGHLDCIIDDEVVDIKTASGFAFYKFKNGTLREDDPFGYLGQLAGYEESEGTENGGFLVINKESGELCLYCPEDLDKPNIISKIETIKKCLKKKSPPKEYCYKPMSEVQKGNEKLHKNCGWCPYKYKCFKDSNGGEGLRTFKYAKGNAYLTKVVVEPKVPEITDELQAL